MSWLRKPSPQEQTDAQLLRQWRAARVAEKLSDLPLELFLRKHLRRLEKEKLAEKEKTGLLPAQRSGTIRQSH